MRDRQLSSINRPMTFFMASSTDHQTGITGLVGSLTVTVSKDGGAYASPVGAVSEVGNGVYALAGNATDRNTLGAFQIHATAAGCDVTDKEYDIVAYDPFNAVNLALSGLPAVSPGTTNGLPIVASDGGVTVHASNDKTGYALTTAEHTAIGTDAAAGVSNLGYTTGRAAGLDSLAASGVSIGSPGASGITLASSASAVDGMYVGHLVRITSGTGAGQARTIAGYVGGTRTATVDRPWVVTPDNTSAYQVIHGDNAALNASLQPTVGGVSQVTLAPSEYAAITGAVMNYAVEQGITFHQATQAIAAATAGVLLGAGTAQMTAAALGNPTTIRLTVTVDQNGNRLTVTPNLT